MGYKYHDILKEQLRPEDLKGLASGAGLQLLDLVNFKSAVYKKLKVDAKAMTEAEIGGMLSEQPRIMIRPLLSDGKNLVRGFKPDEMEKLL